MNPDPELTSTTASTSRPLRRFRISVRKMMAFIVAVGCFFGVITLLARAMSDAREAARRGQCQGHLSQLRLAFHNYHAAYGGFPPAFVADATGKPMDSCAA